MNEFKKPQIRNDINYLMSYIFSKLSVAIRLQGLMHEDTTKFAL